MTAMLFLKRSGEKFEPYCHKLYNSYLNGQDNNLLTVQEQHTRLDTWKLAYSPTAKKNGSAFVQESVVKQKDKDKVVPRDIHYSGGGNRNSRYKEVPLSKWGKSLNGRTYLHLHTLSFSGTFICTN